MTGSLKSYRSFEYRDIHAAGTEEDHEDGQLDGENSGSHREEDNESDDNRTPTSSRPSPFLTRRSYSTRTVNERSSLLGNGDRSRRYESRTSTPGTPRYTWLGRQNSGMASVRMARPNHSRTGSFGQQGFSQRLVNALTAERTNNPELRESSHDGTRDNTLKSC